jgi:hypothetical protein
MEIQSEREKKDLNITNCSINIADTPSLKQNHERSN